LARQRHTPVGWPMVNVCDVSGFCTNCEQDLKCCKATIKATSVYSIAKPRRLPVFRCSKPEGLRLPMVHMLSLRSIRHRSTAAGDATRIMAGGRHFSI
jgi:hypothetical protein